MIFQSKKLNYDFKRAPIKEKKTVDDVFLSN